MAPLGGGSREFFSVPGDERRKSQNDQGARSAGGEMNVRVDKGTITLGNILSIATTIIGFSGIIVTATMYIATLREQMNVKDRELETRILRIETDMAGVRGDHDLIIEIRSDLKAIRSSLDKVSRDGR